MENNSQNGVRIDKFLWSIRVYKTRTIATDECGKGTIMVNNQAVKASRLIKAGDIIQVRKKPVLYTFKVLQLLEKRVSASLVENYVQNITPQEELDKLDNSKLDDFYIRDRGAGRPTKKERRFLDKLTGNSL